MESKAIEDALLEMGVPANVKGFNYVVMSAKLIENGETQITKVYKEIASSAGTTPAAVEHAIRYVFLIARSCRSYYDAVEHYIGFSNNNNYASLTMLLLRIHSCQTH